MKIIIIFIVVVDLFFNNHMYIKHSTPKETTNYENIEILKDIIIINIIFLVIINLLLVFS